MRPINVMLLDEPAALDMRAVAQAIRSRYPSLPVELVGAKDATQGKDAPGIRCDGEIVVVMNKPTPARRDAGIDAVWTRAAVAWPEELEVRDRHCAHIVVATPAEGRPPLKEARILTAVIGGLLEILPQCSGVMWGPQVGRSAAEWKDQSRAAFAAYPDYPFQLWIDILPMKTEAGVEVVTCGLLSFVGREIEFELGRLALSDVLNNVTGLAAYLIEHGDVVKDGDTFGGSEGERIEVKYAMSSRLPDVPILRITGARA